MKQPLQQPPGDRLLNILLLLLFLAGSFLYVEYNYRYWYHFVEQYTMFRYTGDYFLSFLQQPGGLNGWMAEFAMQAYYFSCGAACLIAFLLAGLAALFFGFLRRCGAKVSMGWALLPAALYWIWPAESVAVLLAAGWALALVLACTGVKPAAARYVVGFVLLTLCYFVAAPAHLLFALLWGVYEACRGEGKGRWLIPIASLAWALVVPLVAMRTMYVVPMREAFLSRYLYHPGNPVPVSLALFWAAFPGVAVLAYLLRDKRWIGNQRLCRVVSLVLLAGAMTAGVWWGSDPLEQVYRYDYLARQGRWNEIVDYSLAHGVHDKDALIYTNLAASHAGRFNEVLLRVQQIGEDGFIPYDPQGRLGLIEATEVAWQLNHINAAQRFAFIGVMTAQRCIQPRLIVCLVETYLVNEEYVLAEKYIKLLETTRLYRPEARRLRALLDERDAAATGWLADKRRLRSVTDNSYDITRIFPSAMAYLLDEHWDNTAAFQYAMGFLLVNKDFGTFLHYAGVLRDHGQPLPPLYQEALCLIYATMRNNPDEYRSYAIDPSVYERFVRFAQGAKSLPPAAVQQQYGDTYYYYAQFAPSPQPVKR